METVEQLREARVAFGEPLALGRQRRREERELLIRREVSVAHDGGRRDLKVHGSEQLGVQRRLLTAQLARRRGRQADHVEISERGDDGADEVAPQRCEVMALVENQAADPVRAQRLDPSPHARRDQLVERDAEILTASDRSLQARDLILDGMLEALTRVPGESLDFGPCLLERRPSRPRALGNQSLVRGCAQRPAGVRGLADGLVGENVQRAGGTGERRRRVGEQPELLRPLLGDRRGRREHQRRAAEPAHDLEPDHRLARAGRSDQMRRCASSRPVGFERVERHPLVGPQRAAQLQLGE